MKLKRLVSILLCLVLLLPLAPIRISAFERKDHDKYMSQVLFKNFKEIKSKEDGTDEESALYALECASYLTIDQFNGSGQAALDTLNAYGVQDIPTQIKSIDYTTSVKDHRSSTHRGWDFTYVGSAKKQWAKRKKLLQKTADTVFDFNNDSAKRDSFCALIYYIHILGDHLADKSFKVDNGLKIDVGGREDHYDIITELKKNSEILFKEQINTHKYISLVAKLDQYDAKLRDLVKSEGGINTDEKFEAKQEYTQEVMELLTLYIPEMLKSEEFFAEVFYK